MTGQLTPDILLSAYRAGIFPMAESATNKNIFWVDPKYRGIMPLNKFHVSKSLSRAIMKLDYQISVNTSFEKVIKMCAERPETWINHEIITNYCLLFQRGHAHCLEVWNNKKLIGVFDLNGKKLNKKINSIAFEIFEDGSVEKRYYK